MPRVHVGSLDAHEPGAKHIVETDRGEGGVFNVDGEFYAITSPCARRGWPPC
jgi:nitrite reductase/ring-hydroxylating ferredoxin subunit